MILARVWAPNKLLSGLSAVFFFGGGGLMGPMNSAPAQPPPRSVPLPWMFGFNCCSITFRRDQRIKESNAGWFVCTCIHFSQGFGSLKLSQESWCPMAGHCRLKNLAGLPGKRWTYGHGELLQQRIWAAEDLPPAWCGPRLMNCWNLCGNPKPFPILPWMGVNGFCISSPNGRFTICQVSEVQIAVAGKMIVHDFSWHIFALQDWDIRSLPAKDPFSIKAPIPDTSVFQRNHLCLKFWRFSSAPKCRKNCLPLPRPCVARWWSWSPTVSLQLASCLPSTFRPSHGSLVLDLNSRGKGNARWCSKK